MRERAQRMVVDHVGEYDSEPAATSRSGGKSGMTPETFPAFEKA